MISVGGTFDKMSIEVYKVADIVEASRKEKITQPHVVVKGQIPVIE